MELKIDPTAMLMDATRTLLDEGAVPMGFFFRLEGRVWDRRLFLVYNRHAMGWEIMQIRTYLGEDDPDLGIEHGQELRWVWTITGWVSGQEEGKPSRVFDMEEGVEAFTDMVKRWKSSGESGSLTE